MYSKEILYTIKNLNTFFFFDYIIKTNSTKIRGGQLYANISYLNIIFVYLHTQTRF